MTRQEWKEKKKKYANAEKIIQSNKIWDEHTAQKSVVSMDEEYGQLSIVILLSTRLIR
jgi:hypothetical protein